MAARKKLTDAQKKDRVVKRTLAACKFSPAVRKELDGIRREIEEAYADRFKEGKAAINNFLTTLPKCGAEDMGGWPACSRVGSYGPSEEHLAWEGKRADRNVYCDWHAKESFRGRPFSASAELPYAGLVRFMFQEAHNDRFGGMPPTEHATEQAYLDGIDACFKKKHDVVEADRYDADPDLACWDCGILHRNPKHG